MNDKLNPNLFIKKIKDFDNYIFNISKELDPYRGDPIVTGSPRVKWTVMDDTYIYKAMSLDSLKRLQASNDFLNLFNFSCFENFEVIFKGNIFAIIKQKKLKRLELSEDQHLTLSIIQDEIKNNYPDISFYPFKNLSPYQKRFYLDYPDEFYKLMMLIKTFEIKDAIEFSNCGIDPETNKIKCFDLEIQGRHSIKKIEKFINTFSSNKNFQFPSYSIFLSN